MRLARPAVYARAATVILLAIIIFTAPNLLQAQQQTTVPSTLEEAHIELRRILTEEQVNTIRKSSEASMVRYHMGLGMWMRNNWGLWSGNNTLYRHFQEMGLFHPDDMSGLILDTFWSKLNDQPLRIEERIAVYQLYWRSAEKPKGNSPKDGGKIASVIIQHKDVGATHLGISVSDRSYWRFEYGGAEKIEPATNAEAT